MVVMYKSFYLDLPILEISKIAMHKFWCDYVKPKYGEKAIMGHMNTESFIMCLKAEDIYKDIAKYIKTRFDTSICKLHRSLTKEKKIKCYQINPFLVNVPILYLWLSGVFRWYRMRTLVRNGEMKMN